ncbi:MAG: CDP-diglyceride synthetase [Actinobacteria bacterium BACL4 MAG-120820-bin23]|jgi:phosphatidate cytidylyltransferase|nr:MAG: CDP-diglyceride synthetase [Actinobacteria bacterium BACL4 MAG-121001-bin59]KRO50067.1 MAG: CDP-diglyceride synthetase [Actinobacteria bacterium BACL4 MAG-120820-bin23]KRO92058.1 MAG: CDP-diglyceride synthetase [Actinobacteria bacterium BACL4 MAG-120507-bin0]
MMADLHAINDSINKRAGRKLLPSILVSLLLLAIIFTTINTEPLLFFGFIWVVIMIGVREIAHAYRKGGIELPGYVLMIAATVLLVATWNGETEGLAVSAGLTIPILMFTLLLISQKDFIKRSTSAVFITFYLAVLGGFILLLANHPDGALRILALVVLIACNDTFAYIAGVLLGKHKLAPSISPKKSWEGLIGGAIASIVGGSLIFYYLFEVNWIVGAAIGVMTVITATCGDLIESAIKRDLAIKDMSNLLPGHGGIMDRLDSALFTAPAVWFAFELIARYL